MPGYTALLVDDEPEFVTILAERLRLRDVDARVATDGYEALEFMAEHKPAVVVLDVVMPGLGGMEVLREIKRRFPDLPVIMLTGHGLMSDGIQGMRHGAYDYLMKPITVERLLEKMDEATEADH